MIGWSYGTVLMGSIGPRLFDSGVLSETSFNLDFLPSGEYSIRVEAREVFDDTFLNRSTSYTYKQFSSVPEPATVLLLGSGLIGLVGFRKKYKN